MVKNRTISDSGVQLGGNLFAQIPVTGTGVTPAQATALAAPLLQFLNSLPATLDERGVLAYRTNTLALSHVPQLTYGPNHPNAGQLIFAGYSDGDYITRFGGAPMPFIDMDTIPPHALQMWLGFLHGVRDAILNAT